MNVLLISIQTSMDGMGLKYIHHHLLAQGHQSVLLYLPRFQPGHAESMEAVAEFVRARKPGLIGISLMSIEYERACTLTAELKTRFSGVPIVWGGIHPTAAPEECVDHADFVCLGEGEQTMLDMANAIEAGRPLNGINNLCFREAGELRRNPLNPLVQNLDEFPMIHQIPPESFIYSLGKVAPMTPAALRRYNRYGTTVFNVISSRGCPYHCAYCCNTSLHRLYPDWRVRRRSTEHIIAELEHARKQFPELRYVNFLDDCFLACSMEYLREFCGEYAKRVPMRIIAKSTPLNVTPERIELLKGAGLAWFNMGLQSGSDRVCREIYNRRSCSEDFLRAARLLHEHRVAAWYDVIVDNPFETMEDHYRTVETLIETPKPFYPQLFSLVFYPLTDLRKRALEECPEKIEDPTRKDFYIYHKNPLNDLIEAATVLHPPLMRRLVALHRRNPNGKMMRVALLAAKAYSLLLLRPLSYFRVIKMAEGGFWNTVKAVPNYARVGFSVYLGLFQKQGSSHAMVK